MVDFLMRRPRRNMIYSSKVSQTSAVRPTTTHQETTSVPPMPAHQETTSTTQSDNLQLDENCEINVMIDFVLSSGTKRLNMTPLKIRLNPSTLHDESVKKSIVVLNNNENEVICQATEEESLSLIHI